MPPTVGGLWVGTGFLNHLSYLADVEASYKAITGDIYSIPHTQLTVKQLYLESSAILLLSF